jgi:hypothetical protein
VILRFCFLLELALGNLASDEMMHVLINKYVQHCPSSEQYFVFPTSIPTLSLLDTRPSPREKTAD